MCRPRSCRSGPCRTTSPPTDGAAGASAASSAACFSASETRPRIVTPSRSTSSGSTSGSDAPPTTVGRRGRVRAQRLEGAQQDRQALAFDGLADEHDLQRVARHARARSSPAWGSATPLGTTRYVPPSRRGPVQAAASDTAIRALGPVELAAGAEQIGDAVRDPRLGVAVERGDGRHLGRHERVPADHRRDWLVQIDDVVPTGAQLAHRGDRERRGRPIGDCAVGGPAERGAKRIGRSGASRC